MIKNHIVYSDYSEYKFTVSKAEGSYLWDDAGNKLLDFTSGWNVTNLGWNHPVVNEAFIRQAQKTTYVPMWTSDPVQEEYAAAILSAYPGMDTAIRVTGGTEANEVAVKLARAATSRTKIIGFKDTYHGQLFASMALGYRPEYVQAIDPLVPDFIQMDYPAVTQDAVADGKILDDFKSQLDTLLSKQDVAAIFVEPGIVSDWGACRVAVDGFMDAVRKLTKKYGTLMVVDEVGTAFSRTGWLFGIDRYGITPDVVTLAKGIANGAGGMGAVLSRADLVENTIDQANYTSTFGWMPTSCAAALATLQVHQTERVWEKVATLGEWCMTELRGKLADDIQLRGIGLELCIDFENYDNGTELADAVTVECLKNGLSIIAGDGKIQLMPSCLISKEELGQGIEILTSVIKAKNA